MTPAFSRRRFRFLVSLAAATPIVATLVACSTVNERPGRPYQLAPIGSDGHVIIVILDGLRSDLISKEHAPTLSRLISEGAATLDARTVQPSVTLPAITSIVTGVEPPIHRVTWNAYEADRGLVEAATVFDVAHEAGLKTAFFAGKTKLLHIALSPAIDRMEVRDVPAAIVAREAREYLIQEQPNLMLVHLPDVDRAGHEFGWGHQKQTLALRGVDALLGGLIAVLESGALPGPSIVIVTADHGGEGRSHDRRGSSNNRVPWILWGDGIARGKLGSLAVTVTAATVARAFGLDAPADMDTRLVHARDF